MLVAGFSIAGIETCVEVPSLKLAFDLGRCSRSNVGYGTVLISHGHMDHIGAIAHHAARRSMFGMEPGTYVVPRPILREVEALFAAAGALDGQIIPRKIVALDEGEEHALGKNRWVRPFRTFHRVPSQGYTIWEKRHRLRDEYRGLQGAELGALRKKGVAIEDATEVPILSFTGDTRIEVLEANPELQRTETLVVETTFLDDRVTTAEAREMGHIHFDEILARRELLPKTDVVLSHFSARYDAAEIRKIVDARMPEELHAFLRTLGENERQS